MNNKYSAANQLYKFFVLLQPQLLSLAYLYFISNAFYYVRPLYGCVHIPNAWQERAFLSSVRKLLLGLLFVVLLYCVLCTQQQYTIIVFLPRAKDVRNIKYTRQMEKWLQIQTTKKKKKHKKSSGQTQTLYLVIFNNSNIIIKWKRKEWIGKNRLIPLHIFSQFSKHKQLNIGRMYVLPRACACLIVWVPSLFIWQTLDIKSIHFSK